ncbi:Na+/H+ antiporter [Tsukamurella soli]|uniref:Na+/H+ antiporter n=1 Tax=Tsukamurella soli TaxID=644556 RepID=A0ABP8JHI0_9ACTN
MYGLEIVVAVGAALLFGSLAARRLHLTPPLALLGAGLLLGFLPPLHGAKMPPETVLLLFLPALLFWDSLTTSLQEIRRNLRGIVLASTLLVVITAGAVAAVAHGFGVPWGPAWVLGAALAPTDATAIGILGRLLPYRNMTVLRAESLVNDGTALVVYGVALAYSLGRHVGPLDVGLDLLRSYGGGVAAGIVIAYPGLQLRRRIADPMLSSTATALIPFAAYLLAESAGASGVLAVVTAGLWISQASPWRGRAVTRHQTEVVWGLLTFWLNGALFVLVGLQLPATVSGLTSSRLGPALGLVAAAAATLVASRIGFLLASAYTIRLLDRRPSQRGRLVGNRYRIVSGFAGFRGAVSLAIALSIPETTGSGAHFPYRDVIVFVTAGVIVVSLAQGLFLPALVRWAHLPRDTTLREQSRLADHEATEAVLAALDELADKAGAETETVERFRREYERHLQDLDDNADRAAGGDASGPADMSQYTQAARLRKAALAHKRATLTRMRSERRIDDAVYRRRLSALDLEELRLLAGRRPVD